MKRVFPGVLLAFVILVGAHDVYAHGRSTSYITWRMQGAVATVRVKMALLELNALETTWAQSKPREDATTALPAAIRITGASGGCRLRVDSFHTLAAEHGSAAFEWQSDCAGDNGAAFVATQLRSDLLFDIVTGHLALVRFHDEAREIDSVLTAERREVVLPVRTDARADGYGPTMLRFLRAGFEHLMTGWDHLAFLLALVLASKTLKQAVLCLTGFTLGHSLTLSMAALGHAAVNTATVEVLIALSIVLVSMENVWLAENRQKAGLPITSVLGLVVLAAVALVLKTVSASALLGLALFEASLLGLLAKSDRPDRLRWMTATLFGLLHGFGFAGLLNELAVPTGRRVLPLLSFNVGIEVAQVLLVCLAWPALVRLERIRSKADVVVWGSAITIALGVYGCLVRMAG
ncbi:MAG TPA: HupE/UreJ family protein [Polyangium sp.]|nr:HupE/UreJ family protein [Polyangium sp.]